VVETNDNSVAVEKGAQQVQHGQELASMMKEGDGLGGLSGSDCVAGDDECEDMEKTRGKHHPVDFNSGGLQLTQYGVHSPEEVLDEPIDICEHGRFQIMLTDPMDPHVVLKSRRVKESRAPSGNDLFKAGVMI